MTNVLPNPRWTILVLDDELCGLVLRLIRGIEVSDDTMALDLIKQVGWQGHYLAQPHTSAGRVPVGSRTDARLGQAVLDRRSLRSDRSY